jgi:hypothetical protein
VGSFSKGVEKDDAKNAISNLRSSREVTAGDQLTVMLSPTMATARFVGTSSLGAELAICNGATSKLIAAATAISDNLPFLRRFIVVKLCFELTAVIRCGGFPHAGGHKPPKTLIL